MKTTRCPVCKSDVIIEDEAFEGDLVDCTNCGSELEIASLHPLQLAENKDNTGEISGQNPEII